MNVAAILRSKGSEVHTAEPGWTLEQACARLADLGVGALVVSEDGRSIAGIVSERDVICAIAREGRAALGYTVAEVMATDVVTCSPDDDIAHLMGTMTERRIRHLPVVERGQMIGIVSIGDVVKRRIRETEHEAEALRNYIVAG